MLSTMRQSWLLFTILALIALSSALNIEEALHIDGIEGYLHHGVKRQAQGTGNSATSEAPSSTEQPSSPASSRAQTPTPTPTPTDDSSSNVPTSTQAPPASSPTTGGGRQTSAPGSSAAASTAAPTSTRITTPVVKTSALVATSVQQYTTVYTTISDGQNVAVTSVGSSVALITTGLATETQLPSPQSGSGSGGGLSDTNKKVIGGVVGGVGGAILLGGIAIVCWRIWGRKKRVSEDDADLMAGTGSALGDKPQSGSSPFQSNLEQYHNPGGRPNAAANF